MAFVIAEPCLDLKDGACLAVCPMDCIYGEETADRMLFIHPTECIDCGACEPVCPVGAILFQEEVPEEWEPFTTLNRLYFEDKAAARLEINRLYPQSFNPGSAQKGKSADK